MNDYEILLMLDPESPEERHDEVIARTRELVENGGGTWLSHDPWGRRRLAYEIDHKTDGVYHLLQFDTEPETLNEITRVLKITDDVMRHMATRRIKGGGRVAPPPQPVFEPEPERVPEPVPAAAAPEAPEVEPEAEETPEAEAEAEAGTADSEVPAEEYAEPTESESEPAPAAEPEEGA